MVQVVDLLRSNCISWSPEAKSLRRRFHSLKDEKRSFESRRKCMTTGERPELSNFSEEKFSPVSGLDRSGRRFRALRDQRFAAGPRQGQSP